MSQAANTQPKNPYLSNLHGDLTGGLIAAIVALPLALAFGVASGLGAEAGLYGAIACGLFVALFGGTPGQVSGPTGPMTVVAAGIVATHAGRPELVFGAVILGGLLQIIIGAIRGGQLVHYIPYPVVSGFMTGIGLIIILVEIPPLFGLDTPSSALEGVKSLPQIPELYNPFALIVGLSTIAVIYLLPRFAPKVPASLVALVLATIVTSYMGLDIPQIKDIGEIPLGLPIPRLPMLSFSDLLVIVPAGISLALLGAIDSLLTSVIVDKITHRRHNSNKELVGQGIGNIVSGLVGGLPGAGATMRSVVNIQNGGRTNLSGVVHSIILLVVLLGAASIASLIPLATLAGILVTVGISIMDYRGLKRIPKTARDDVLIMLIVLALTVFLDLITAVLVGLALAAFLFCKRFSDLETSYHGHLDTLSHLHDVIHQIPEIHRKQIYLYTFNGPLFFGEARNFKQVIANLKDVHTMILSFQNVPLIDQTGLFSLEDSVHLLENQGSRVLFVGLAGEVKTAMERIGLIHRIPDENFFESLEEAVHHLAEIPQPKAQPR